MVLQSQTSERVRSRAFAASLAAHALAVAALLAWEPAPAPRGVVRPAEALPLVAADRTLPPLPRPSVKPRALRPRVETARLPAPAVAPAPARLERSPAPRIELEASALPAVGALPPLAPAAPVLAAAAVRAVEPPAPVRSARFGAMRVDAAGPSVAARLQVGGFGAAEGSRDSVAPSEVRGAGFGQSVPRDRRAPGPATATSQVFAAGSNLGPGGGSRPAAVAEGGFGAASSTRASAPAPAAAPPDAAFEPVEVLAKPKPEYTAEARARRVEGEVVVETLFRADGRAEPLRIVRGLGHGLDQSARNAVERIRFRPARRDGQPVDSTLAVAVAFHLAY